MNDATSLRFPRYTSTPFASVGSQWVHFPGHRISSWHFSIGGHFCWIVPACEVQVTALIPGTRKPSAGLCALTNFHRNGTTHGNGRLCATTSLRVSIWPKGSARTVDGRITMAIPQSQLAGLWFPRSWEPRRRESERAIFMGGKARKKTKTKTWG